jgi:hypothetical protein
VRALAVQAGVVERHGGAEPQVLRKPEVVFVVAPPALGRHEGDGSEGLAAGRQRHHHRRPHAEVADELEMPFVDGAGFEQLVRDLGIELAASGAYHRRGPVGASGSGG